MGANEYFYTASLSLVFFSILDGASKPANIVKRCVELGLPTCAITDHNVVSGAVEFADACKGKIKPIFGSELYISNEADLTLKQNRELSHMVVLAKNLQGWKQLVKIISESNKPEHFYYKPRLNLDTLSKFLDGNIIGLSGHPGSYLFNEFFTDPKEVFSCQSEDEVKKYIRPDWVNHVKGVVLDLQQRFHGNFFIEIQLIDAANMPAANLIAKGLRYISKQTSIPCVATDDAHYVNQEDAVDQRVLLCINMKLTLREIQNKMVNQEDIGMGNFFRYSHYYIHSYDEMVALGHTEAELEQTVKIAEMCEEYKITKSPDMPKFPVPNGLSSDEYLKQLCREGWVRLKNKIYDAAHAKGVSIDVYAERFKEEFTTLTEVGLADYFLIVHDVINYARSRGQLTGSGRGSAAGSLLLYLLGVTQVDPIYYDLLFARFYNAGRNTKDHISLPDVDCDFESQGREDIIEYLKNKYGHDKVAQIITFGRMQGRAVLKDVFRVYSSCSFEEMNKITEFIPDEAAISDKLQEMKEADKERGGDGTASIIQWALENHTEELKPWCYIKDDGTLEGPMAKRFEQAIRLEGVIKSSGKHAAGIIIANEPLANLVPMVYDSVTKNQIVGFDYESAEKMGTMKLDCLSVAILDKIHNIQNLLETGHLS